MNVLIFGGSTDIGINIATYLKKYGYNVIATYNSHLIDTDYEFIHCDIRNESNIEDTIKYVINKYGKIDILINLAAVSYDNLLLDTTKEEFMDLLEINLVGTYLTNKIYCKYYSDGMIINMSSTDGIDTYNKYNTFYAASKAAIINLSKSVALNTNNKVLCLCPNWIDSDSTRDMDKNFLKEELERIGQSRLITLDELNSVIYEIISGKRIVKNTVRIDIKGDKLWIEEI